MIFKEYGNRENPTIIILHGGGLSYWSVEPVAEILLQNFHVVLPVIDGHGEDGQNQFNSIRESAENIITYIDKYNSGSVHALCGLSIGAQIVVDVLSLRLDICSYSIIESALLYPLKFVKSMLLPMVSLSYPLIRKKWYSDLQAKYLLIPKVMYDLYYVDSCKISKQSLKNIIRENSTFNLDIKIKETKSKVLILYGEKEINIMKRSAELLSNTIPDSTIISYPNYGHGEISQLHPEDYSSLLLKFMRTK